MTRAREVFAAEGLLHDASKLRRVIDLPIDLDELDQRDRLAVENFLKRAKEMGAHQGYVASHRKAWWAVGLRAAAPIISTYMARRPPAFVVNRADARHINIAHGLYPRIPITETAKATLVCFMQTNVSQRSGPHLLRRAYQVRAARDGAPYCPRPRHAEHWSLSVIEAPKWTAEQLEADRVKSIVIFRNERTEEPLEDYLKAFDKYQGHIEELLEATVDLTQLESQALEVVTDPRLLEAVRYLAAPPISEDDLKVLAEASSLAKRRLRSNPEDVRRLVEIVRLVLDRRRFAWVVENREPLERERDAAVMASAALMAASRVQTNWRSFGKTRQEEMVKDALRRLGLTQVQSRIISNFAQAPDPGDYCRESSFGGRKADIIVRLWDHRVMPVECKVSSSALNLVKRLNNDAA